MWPFRAPAPAPDDLLKRLQSAVAMMNELVLEHNRRLDEHDDKHEQMGRRFKKLQGEFNGYMRDRYEADADEDWEADPNG